MITDNLTVLQVTKDDIKTAIENSGVNVDVTIDGYADLIRGLTPIINEAEVNFYSWMTFSGSTASDVAPFELFYDGNNGQPYDGKMDYVNMFSGCKNITHSPKLPDTKPYACAGMFLGCTSLTTAPNIDTSQCYLFDYMFENCTSLTTAPAYAMARRYDNYGASAEGMFKGCTSLTNIPIGYFGNAEDLRVIYKDCTGLQTVTYMNMPDAQYVDGMFENCTSLTTVSGITSNSAEHASKMFKGCTSLTSVEFSMPKLRDVSYMFDGCTNLTDLGLLDFSNVQNGTYVSNLFRDCVKLTNVGGFTNFKGPLDLRYTTRLTSQSLKNIVNSIAEGNTSSSRIYLNEGLGLYDYEVTMFTNKGWTVYIV
jgi:hypothetical protein